MSSNHHVIKMLRTALGVAAAAGSIGLAATPAPLGAQWSTVSDQFYYPGSFNWRFRHNYPAADRLFNAFDYGHAILYERLYTRPNAPVSVLEEKEYDFITRELLVHPPRVPLEEGAIEVAYAKIAPEAKQMFDWAHVLHRQIYDVWADERLTLPEKDARVAELLRYYKSRPDVAFSSQPKTMELMEGQYYSGVFRERYPKFNGLIWAYHWLQVGLYEPLMVGKTLDERQTGVIAAVARFRQMIENPPSNMPRVMPMTAAVAPTFAARYPEAAIIFDNLHGMHDVISDILASPKVPRSRKRAEILKAAERYRDATSFVTTERGWREMAQMMGIQNMGGPAVNFLADFPAPTVERGAMAGMDHGAMNAAPARTDGAMSGMDHAGMAMPATPGDSTRKAGMAGMAGMNHGAPAPGAASADSMAGMSHDTGARSGAMMEMHMRMLADPVIRGRIATDTALRRMMTESIDAMPAGHQTMMREMLSRPVPSARPAKSAPAAKRTTTTPKPAATKKPVAKPPAKPQPEMDHSKMPGMDHSKMPSTTKP